nr:MAG TPA: hypothetical protein [Caudoviricetes sp.]
MGVGYMFDVLKTLYKECVKVINLYNLSDKSIGLLLLIHNRKLVNI